MVTERSAWGQEESKYHSYLQAGQEGDPIEIQVSQFPNWDTPWEGDGNNSWSHFKEYDEQERQKD